MKWVTILFLCILSGLSSAQYTFRYEYDSIRTMPTSFVEVEDGFVIAGAKHPNQGNYDIQLYDSHLIKINHQGEFQWVKEINEPFYDNIFSIQYDGHYFFALGIDYNATNDRLTYFLKFDQQGNLLLKTQIGNTSYTLRDNLPMNLAIKKDGTILINNSEYNFSTGNTECVVYTLDKNGEILKRTAFAQNTRSCVPYDLIESTDHGFVAIMSALDLTLLHEEIYILKFDELGNEMWRQLIQTDDPVQADFSICDFNNYIYCAMATTYVNTGPARLTLVKYDETGTSLFQTHYANYSPPEPESFDYPRITLNQDSTGLLIFGSFAGAQTVFNPTLLFTDLLGNVYKSVGIPYLHSIGNGWSVDINLSNDGGIALLNNNYSAIPQVANYTELIKLDCQGNFKWKDECNFIKTSSDVLVYPNPSTGIFDLSLSESTSGINSIQVYNMEGRLLFESNSATNSAKIDLSDLNQGIYLLKVQTVINENEVILTERIIVSK